MAERYFPSRNLADAQLSAVMPDTKLALRVVGIVRHVPIRGLDPLEEPPQVYRPFSQHPNAAPAANLSVDFVLKTSRSASELADATRHVLTQLNPNHAPAGLASMHEKLARQSMPQRILGGVLGSFGVVALALAAFGVYASTRRSVVDSKRDLAVQVALGASPRQIVRHVLGRTGRSVGSGLVLGVVGLALVGQAMRSVLYGVTPLEPLVALVAIAVVGVAALIAAVGPALRAAKVDPMLALRHE
jgi:ABC-type antimicrobial peptide transport system permease subunit